MAKILFITHHPREDASSRYRVYDFVPYLEAAGHTCTVRPFSTERLFRILRRGGHSAVKVLHAVFCSIRRMRDILEAGSYDLVLINREAYPFFTPFVEKLLMAQCGNVVYNFDDAVYMGHGQLRGLGSPLLYKMKYGAGFNDLIRDSKLVLGGSQALVDYALQFNTNVALVPTVIDLQAYVYNPRPVDSQEPITVGWLGSNSTSPYLPAIEPALRRLAENNPGRVRFRFVGDAKLRMDLPNCEILPFRLNSEIEDLGMLDIGLMPLHDTPWTRCKCSFKAIQYMGVGAVPVVSPVGMAASLIEHGVDGFHATTENDWYERLQELLDDPMLRLRMAASARAKVEENYAMQSWGPKFASLIERELESREYVSSQVPA
ncbi:MAG: glycosyltransferase family 4 protein [Acidobacteriaceae bacterium]